MRGFLGQDIVHVLAGLCGALNLIPAKRVAIPAERAGRRQHYPHKVPLPGNRVAKSVQPPLWLEAETLAGGEHHTRSPESDRDYAFLDDAAAHSLGRLVSPSSHD